MLQAVLHYPYNCSNYRGTVSENTKKLIFLLNTQSRWAWPGHMHGLDRQNAAKVARADHLALISSVAF
jgi:hypothetical protein